MDKKSENTYQDFLDALYSRDFKRAKEIGEEIGEEIPQEYISPDFKEDKELEEITISEFKKKETSKPIYNKIYITNQTSENEVLNKISNNANNKVYSVFVFSEKPKLKEYKLVREDAFSYYNFEDPKDADGVKDLYKSAIYYARSYFNKNTAAIMQETKKQIKYHILKSIIDKDGEIRPELPKVEIKDVSIDENLELIVDEGNFQKPGILLPAKEYNWKKEITKKN